jgi:predicted O-methyltransferase YrrM
MADDRIQEAELCGQLSSLERKILVDAILNVSPKPQRLLEVGSWFGGGSTIEILKVLRTQGEGHLWGIEADPVIYQKLVANVPGLYPEESKRFTPVLGRSADVIPRLLRDFGEKATVDFVLLDGGDNPGEQIAEFKLLNSHIPVGGQVMSHDAKLRKGRWLVPYVSCFDNWSTRLHDISAEGLFHAVKTGHTPSMRSRLRAELNLLIRMLNPIEVLAALFPASLNRFILAHMPKHLAVRLSQGRG